MLGMHLIVAFPEAEVSANTERVLFFVYVGTAEHARYFFLFSIIVLLKLHITVAPVAKKSPSLNLSVAVPMRGELFKSYFCNSAL